MEGGVFDNIYTDDGIRLVPITMTSKEFMEVKDYEIIKSFIDLYYGFVHQGYTSSYIISVICTNHNITYDQFQKAIRRKGFSVHKLRRLSILKHKYSYDLLMNKSRKQIIKLRKEYEKLREEALKDFPDIEILTHNEQ